MKKRFNLSLLCGVMAYCAMILSGCNNVGNNLQSLEVENHILAQKGLHVSSSYNNQDVVVDFKDIAYGNNMYMVVGSHGAIYTSPDAMQWTERVNVTDLNLNGVAYNSKYKKFYAVGDDGKVFTTADGVAWVEYKTLNKSVNLNSIGVLQDGDEVIGSNSGSIYEIEFLNDISDSKTHLAVRTMWSQTGKENSIVNAVASNSLYMVAGSSLSSINVKATDNFSSEWEYSGSNNVTGVSDIFYNEINSTFISLSKDGYVSTENAKVYNSPWSVPKYTNFPDKTKFQNGITTNSIAVDHNSSYTFIAGGDKNNRDAKDGDTFIRYSKDFSTWGNGNIINPKTGSLNKVRCFSGAPESMCIAVGDKKAIVIIKIKDDQVDPEPIDITDPKIISFVPNDGATNVSTNSIMDITFNKAVTNVNSSTIKLYEDHVSSDSDVELTTFEASDNKDEYTFSATHKLKSNTDYLVIVESGIHDKYGKNIIGKTFHFKTGYLTNPEGKVIKPAKDELGVSILPSIEILFSEPVNNVNTRNVTLREGSPNGISVAIANPSATDQLNYVFTPTYSLEPLTKYCVVLDSGITNKDGVGINKTYSCFVTGSNSSLSLIMINPKDEETNVSLLPRIAFKFSTDVTGVNSENIQLHEGSENGAVVALGPITESSDKSYLTYTKTLLKSNTKYYLVFDSGIKDASNPENVLAKTNISFTTKTDGIAAVASGDTCIYAYKRSGVFNCTRKIDYSIYKLVYAKVLGDNKYIGVGENGTAFISNDGINWSPASTGTKNNLYAISFLNSSEGVVVAVGDKGTILVSNNNGANWTVKDKLAGDKNLRNVYSDGEHFYIAVDGGDWLYSDDKGVSWTKKTDIASIPKQGVQNVFSSNGTYHILGGSNGVVYASSDNMNSWVEQTSVLYKPNGKSVYSSFNKYLFLKNESLNLLFGNDNTMFISSNDEIKNDKWTRVTAFDTGTKIDFVDASVNTNGDLFTVTSEGAAQDGGAYISANGTYWVNIVKLKSDSLYSIAAVD